MNNDQIQEEFREVNGLKIRVTTYKVGHKFHCQVSDPVPEATIAKATGPSKEAAVNKALNKASERIIIKGKSL
ncbi:MAG: hypothetical protein ACHQD9_00980 [Chitinophagales bacterium]